VRVPGSLLQVEGPLRHIPDSNAAGTHTFQLGEEAPPSFPEMRDTGKRVISSPWTGRLSRCNLRGVTSSSVFPLATSFTTNAPFTRLHLWKAKFAGGLIAFAPITRLTCKRQIRCTIGAASAPGSQVLDLE